MNAKTAVLSVLVAVTVLFVVLSMHFRARSQDAETPTETQYIINGLYQFPHSHFRGRILGTPKAADGFRCDPKTGTRDLSSSQFCVRLYVMTYDTLGPGHYEISATGFSETEANTFTTRLFGFTKTPVLEFPRPSFETGSLFPKEEVALAGFFRIVNRESFFTPRTYEYENTLALPER